MDTDDSQALPPPSDLEEWRLAIANGLLHRLRMEIVVAGVQKLGPHCDPRVLNPMVLHISDCITRVLSRFVGRNKPNRDEIIERAHAHLIDSVLKPNSADGKGLKTAFVARVEFRGADAIRAEDLRKDRYPSYDQYDGVLPSRRDEHWTNEEQDAYVERLLETAIADPRKRMAFRLHMDGVPLESTKGVSIAEALAINPKTAGEWVKEIQETLKNIVGDRS